MSDRNYAIVLNTPLGKRNGTMALHISGERVDGYLDLFQHREAVCGELRGDGSCWLHGKFVTMMSEFYYEAVGWLDQSRVELTLRGRRGEYQMLGTAAEQTNADGGVQ